MRNRRGKKSAHTRPSSTPSVITTVRVAAQQLHQSGFEVDPEPLPLQHEKTEPRRRIAGAQAGPDTTWRKEERQKSRFQQHSIRLVGREVLERCDAREEENLAHRHCEPWPEIEDEKERRDQSGDNDQG